MFVSRTSVTSLMVSCFLVIHAPHFLLADEVPAIPTEKMMLVVTAPDGSPVVGAKVKPDGLRTKVEPASHYGWSPERHGLNPELLTNDKGEVEITHPKYVVEQLETGKVTLSIDHPDFVLYRKDNAPSQVPYKIELKKGYQLRIFAVVKHKGIKKIKSRLHGLIHDGTARSQFEWISEEQGTFISPAFERKKTIAWAVRLTEKPFLFSDTFEIDSTQTKDEVNQTRRTILLKPGYRVEGRIDDAVPRPIKNGRVLVWVTPSKRPAGWGGMVWQDVAEIKADGTFLFESLPRCEAAQVLALCDGWISAPPRGEDFDVLKKGEGGGAIHVQPGRVVSGTYAQVHRIDTQEPSLNVKMEKTVSVEFSVLKPDQSPLAGATVMMGPNQFIQCSGANYVGESYPTHEVLSFKNPTAYYEKKVKKNRHPFSAITDAKGRATITDLPARTSIGWGVQDEKYDMPVHPGGSARRYKNLDATQSPIPLQTIVMEKKGTHVLGKKNSETKPKKKRKRGIAKPSAKQE